MKKPLALFGLALITIAVVFLETFINFPSSIYYASFVILTSSIVLQFINANKTQNKINKIENIFKENEGEKNCESEHYEKEETLTDSTFDLQTEQLGQASDNDFDESLLHSQDLEIYSVASKALFNNIVNYLNSTSEPMSESLVKIKVSISEFITKIQDLRTNYEDGGQADSLRSGIEAMRSQISDLTQSSVKSCINVSNEIQDLEIQMNSILELVGNISDVAERIHVLSINASIESARAGAHGRGFKIIADEVQRLALETSDFVVTIGDTVSGTRDAFSSLYSFMKEHEAASKKYEEEDKTTYTYISNSIEEQIQTVLIIYDSVLTFIDALKLEMNVFSPIGMLHAIITQEIENLEKVNSSFTKKITTVCNDYELNEDSKETRTKESIDEIRKHLTTSRELHILAKSLDSAGFTNNIDMNRNKTEIEFF